MSPHQQQQQQQLTPVASNHAYHFKHPLQNQHPNPSIYTHTIIKNKVHVIVETLATTVMLFLSRY